MCQMQLSEETQGLRQKIEDLEQLKVQLRQLSSRPNNQEYEARIQSLTGMLMTKQINLLMIVLGGLSGVVTALAWLKRQTSHSRNLFLSH